MKPGNKPAHFIYKDNETIGFVLYSDFVSEHEQGIKGILDKLKVNQEEMGIEKRIINIPLEFKNKNGITYLTTSEEDIDHYIKPSITNGAWGNDNFIFYTNEDTKQFDNFKTSLLKDKYAITVGRNITIQRLDTINKQTKEELLRNDKLRKLTNKIAEQENITGFINSEINKWRNTYLSSSSPWNYFAISPRLNENNRTLSYWLNPSHQDYNNHGWYKPEDFKLWIEGKGPIPRSNDHYKFLYLISKIKENFCLYEYNRKHYNLYPDNKNWLEHSEDIYNAIVKRKLDKKAIKAIESRVKPYCRELYNHYTSFTNNEESFVELNKYMDNYNKSELQRRQIHSALTSYADAGLLYKNGACNTPAKRENKNWWADVLDNEIKYEFILNSGVYNEEEVKFLKTFSLDRL
jgi:hypothetical protein